MANDLPDMVFAFEVCISSRRFYQSRNEGIYSHSDSR